MNNNIAKPKGKIIRDAVHGDIHIPDKFLRIIDTPEFQRLRRIRQLSTANMLFPTAEHTRFSHSLGCYHVMNLLIEHFRPILTDINIEIDDEAVDLARTAALLHDIGHGPFSHAFEGALPNTLTQKKHEEWTTEIITDKESKVQNVLVNQFNSSFPGKVAELISKGRQISEDGLQREQRGQIDLFFILSSLISSQLDADRMDYLIRDSYFTGVPYGKIDLPRLISSLSLTVSNNQYYVCVQEKYLSTIEDYVLARYQMHNGIYFHRFKCEMELVLKKTLYRAFQLYKEKKLDSKDLPIAITKTFEGQNMSVTDYIGLDDSIILFLFSKWKKENDPLLSALCTTLLDRNKYTQIMLLNNTKSDIADFKIELKELLSKYDYNVANFENEYFWIQDSNQNKIYKNSKENIWILKNDGTLHDLMDVSRLITKELDEETNIVFINLEILQQNIDAEHTESAVEDTRNLIRHFNKRNQIEIEKKYTLTDQELFKKVEEQLKLYKGSEYEIKEVGSQYEQIDTYYDITDEKLDKSGITLRIRNKNGKYIVTIKAPTAVSDGSVLGQNERFEYEKELKSSSLEEAKEHIEKYVPLLRDPDLFSQLKETLIVKNKRRKFKLTNKNIMFEMVFDDVDYVGNGKSAHEYQIEIELKSDFIHRINLKMLTDFLENAARGLTATNKSKYRSGLSLTR